MGIGVPSQGAEGAWEREEVGEVSRSLCGPRVQPEPHDGGHPTSSSAWTLRL